MSASLRPHESRLQGLQADMCRWPMSHWYSPPCCLTRSSMPCPALPCPAPRRHVGAPSTWSLERLDSLAAEAASGFYRACQALGVHEAVALASAGTAPDSILWTLHLDLVRSYPTHLLSAVNDVLFLRHGYQRQAAHGNPRDSRLSAVLEGGQGRCVTGRWWGWWGAGAAVEAGQGRRRGQGAWGCRPVSCPFSAPSATPLSTLLLAPGHHRCGLCWYPPNHLTSTRAPAALRLSVLRRLTPSTHPLLPLPLLHPGTPAVPEQSPALS